ncbi:MAG: RibD family protein [Flavobacteriales bacterium]
MRIVNVMGASVDGCIAASPDESDFDRARYGFTNDVDRAHLEAVLSEADAVIVGGHSVNVSGGVIPTPRHDGHHATWIFLTNHGFERDAAIWKSPEVPKWMASSSTIPHERQGTISRFVHADSERTLPQAVLAACRDAHFERVLLFGGGKVNRLFYNAHCVDELILTVCPVLVGASTGVPIVAPELEAPVALQFESMREASGMVFIHYLIRP